MSTTTAPALQPLLFDHSDGRRLVTVAGSPLIAGDPSWYRAGPVEIDPTLCPPAIGAPWPGQGGLYAGLVRGTEGAPDHHLMLATALPPERMGWTQAMAWATGLQHEAHADWSLPTRRESAVLFGNLRDQFEAAWHWTSEEDEDDASYAWSQHFDYGYQSSDVKICAGRARAVRRLILRPFGA